MNGVDLAEAVAAVRADGRRPDVQDSITPVPKLVSVTSTVLGQTGGPPFDAPKYQDVLAWDVVFLDAAVQLYGPVDSAGDPDIGPCDLHVVVDGTSGAVIEGFQTCGAA